MICAYLHKPLTIGVFNCLSSSPYPHSQLKTNKRSWNKYTVINPLSSLFPYKKFSHVYYFQDSSIYVINGILMMATFFTFRVIFIPMIYFWFASNKSVGMFVALQMIPLKCHLTTLCVWIPQLYWFYKMVNGLQKLLQEQKMSKLKSSWKLSHVST